MWPPTGLIPWFSKTEGNTYATIAASPFPLQGKPTQAQDVAQGMYCIVAIEDKNMGFISYCMILSLYIMSSCLRRYSVFNLIL